MRVALPASRHFTEADNALDALSSELQQQLATAPRGEIEDENHEPALLQDTRTQYTARTEAAYRALPTAIRQQLTTLHAIRQHVADGPEEEVTPFINLN